MDHSNVILTKTEMEEIWNTWPVGEFKRAYCSGKKNMPKKWVISYDVFEETKLGSMVIDVIAKNRTHAQNLADSKKWDLAKERFPDKPNLKFIFRYSGITEL